MKNAVWISRPRRRALSLARELRRHNLAPVIKPAIRIFGAANDNFRALLTQPQLYDLAIFVSEEAVRRCHKKNAADSADSANSTESPLPALAVGAATLAALESLPLCAAIRAPAGDTDALLRLPHLQTPNIADKKIAVVGGVSDGKPDSLSPKLCAALQKRGAEVFCAVAYRRTPSPPDSALAKMLGESVRAAVAYSGDTAEWMLRIVAPAREKLTRLPLFVMHPNIAAAARKAGFCNVHIAPPDAAQMAAAIAAHLRRDN